MCVVLGMGLPTTANYIVVASVMAQPLVTLAAQNGLMIPLFAVHLFVFNFGLMSGTTPPVAVESYWSAALIIVSATVAMCIFAAATPCFFLVKNYKLESALMIVIALSLLRPAFWLDQVQPASAQVDPNPILEIVETAQADAQIQMFTEGAFPGISFSAM